VGVYRLLKELDVIGIKATFAINAEVARRCPPLIEAIKTAGHEIAAHGVSTAHIHYDGLGEEDERALISEARSVFPDATSWMSPARNESYRTLDLLAEAGFTTCLDWEADQRPLPFKTANGPVWSLPHYNELGDFKLLLDRSQSEDAWAAQIIEAAAYHVDLYEKEGASAFGFTMTPYVAGQPFRVHAVRRILKTLAAMDGLQILTAADTIKQFRDVTV
ncbi:MAG: polysaccharide deacetylase family protein, partial [Pseudomonadota bacterium]